jgi:hypothetical protein
MKKIQMFFVQKIGLADRGALVLMERKHELVLIKIVVAQRQTNPLYPKVVL